MASATAPWEIPVNTIARLLPLIQDEEVIFIQTHNYPDPDAVAAAFGLQQLLVHYQISSHLVYEGEIQRCSLATLITDLGIEIHPSHRYTIQPEHKIIVVDGCKGNKNVTDLLGQQVGVIDHHENCAPEDVSFCDLRPDYGSCSSIIYSYFLEADLPIPPPVATALLVGINIDTDRLSRHVSSADLLAHTGLYPIADQDQVGSLLRNQIEMQDLDYFRYLIDHLWVVEEFGFCYFPEGCDQNLMGMLSDFILAIQEITFVALCARNGDRIQFSLRSEVEHWNTAAVIDQVLQGIGHGGGHVDRAGGAITDLSLFDVDPIYRRFLTALGLE